MFSLVELHQKCRSIPHQNAKEIESFLHVPLTVHTITRSTKKSTPSLAPATGNPHPEQHARNAASCHTKRLSQDTHPLQTLHWHCCGRLRTFAFATAKWTNGADRVVKFALACSGPWFASCRVLQGLSAQAAAQPLFVKHLSDLSDLSEKGTGAVHTPF